MSTILIAYYTFSPLLLIMPTLLETYVAFKFRLKNSSFFYYFIARSVVSLIAYFLYNILWRLTLYPEYSGMFLSMKNGKWIHAPLLYLGVVHEFIMACIAIDRLFVVVSDLQHKQYWKRLFYFAILFSIISPFLVIWQIFFHDVDFVEYQLNNQFALVLPLMTEGLPKIDLALNMTAVLLTNTVISCVCYFIAYIQYRRKWTNNNSSHHEMKFVILALFSFLSTLPLTVHQLIFAIKGNTLPVGIALFMFEIMPWLVDLNYFAVVYIIFAMNKSFRRNCINTVKLWIRHPTTVLGHSSNHNNIHVISKTNSTTRRTATSHHPISETITNH